MGLSFSKLGFGGWYMYKKGDDTPGRFLEGAERLFHWFPEEKKNGRSIYPFVVSYQKKNGRSLVFFWKILERNDSLKPSNWSGDCPNIFPVIFCILTYIRIPIILWLFFLWHLCGLIGVDIKGHLSVLLNMIAYKPALFWFHLLVSLILLVYSWGRDLFLSLKDWGIMV